MHPGTLCRYWISAASSDSLSVHVYLNGELGPTLWALAGARSAGWEVAEVTVSSPATFRVNSDSPFLTNTNVLILWKRPKMFFFPPQIAFRAEFIPGGETFILLDDVSVRDGACTPTGSCDFESGFCTWMNGDVDNQDWVHTDGRLHDRLVDHTTHTVDGEELNPEPVLFISFWPLH